MEGTVQRLTKRWLWKEIAAVFILFAVLVILAGIIFPLFYTLILTDSGQYIIGAITGTGIYVTAFGALIKRTLNMRFYVLYPSGIEIYHLDEVTESDLWAKLKVSSYPEATYVQHPALINAERMLQEEPLESLKRRPIYITGAPGTGKSTAAIRLASICRKRLRRAILHRPKLLLMNETIIGIENVRMPEFTEPVLILIDDFQYLKKRNQKSIRHLITRFELGEMNGLLVCISREHPRHISPVGSNPIRIDCNLDDSMANIDFVYTLVLQESKRNNVVISEEVSLSFAKKIIETHEPILYIFFLFIEYKRPELTMDDCARIPDGMRSICTRSWDLSTPSQKDFIRTILMLKRISTDIEMSIVSGIYRCFFNRNDFTEVIAGLDGSMWFFLQEDALVAPDSPYEVVEYPDFMLRIKELASLLMGTHYDKEISKCLKGIDDYHSILNDIGAFVGNSDKDFAEECYNSVISISIRKNDFETANLSSYNLGVLLSDAREFLKAETAYRNALKFDSRDMDTWNNLGIILSDSKRYEEAEEAYRKCLELNPNHVEGCNNLAILLHELKRYEESEVVCRKAIELDPNYVDGWNILGIILSDMDEPLEAEKAFRRGLEIDPVNVEILCNFGSHLDDMKRTDEAENLYLHALEIDSKHTDSWCNLGVLYFEENRLDESENAYRRALETDTKHALSWSNLGEVLAKKKVFNEAEQAIRKALDIDSKNPDIMCIYGIILSDSGQSDKAEEVYKKALALDSFHALSLYRLGILLFENGRQEEGCTFLYDARKHAPKWKRLFERIENTLNELCIEKQSTEKQQLP
ncbi:MAG: tetratricopeptide repeat protein [Candidatus Thorarchaeota archaeon]